MISQEDEARESEENADTGEKRWRGGADRWPDDKLHRRKEQPGNEQDGIEKGMIELPPD